ncbi:MAG: DUF1016 family protein [Muribaculaceae bacterium]|nr:DUF1016 family protein [Muribaculaceae bacterium]
MKEENKLYLDKNYVDWISELSKRYRVAQIKASVAVNTEMLKFYWELGKDIVNRQSENKYGSGFFERLSRDLKEAIPEAKGFSVKNLYYIRKFYLMYSDIFPQLGGNFPQVMGNSNNSNLPQVMGNLKSDADLITNVPWGHHRMLIDKFFENTEPVIFYLNEIVSNGWSQVVLDHQISMGLHQRKGRALSNYKTTLPDVTSDLVQQLTKDPYIFDFTNLVEPFKERELKDELLRNITSFLLELGEGFAFVGKEYRLKVGETEQYIDLLFYHLKIRAYFVLEVKVTAFEPGYVSQLGTYVTAVNHLLKTEQDNPTIGLLICKTKDNVLAQYALEGYNLPIGVSEFQLEKFLPENFRSALPSIEEIEARLSNIDVKEGGEA